MTDVSLFINHSIIDLPVGGSGTDYIQVDQDFDYFLFSQGSISGAGVSDGDAIPTDALKNRYAVQLDAVNAVTVPKYFLADFSANLLKEVLLAGNQNKRYAFAVTFDGATATEPQLEAWDNATMSTYLSPSLGGGTPSGSWYKAVCTTAALPGANWVGTPLAGAGVSNVILLNNGSGALSAAGTLYFNFKIVIPGGYTTPALHTPVLAVVYATN